MVSIPIADEHEKKDSIEEDVFYPDHDHPRTESSTFRHTKEMGHLAKRPCAISGHVDGVEYHHVFLEWAFADAVDWEEVKNIATGKVTHLPVLDLETDQPTGEVFCVEGSLIWAICQLVKARGFDWENFEPAKPETFVDSMANMLVLHERYHRHKGHAIHGMTLPEWIFHAWPRKIDKETGKRFVFTPDEIRKAIPKHAEEHNA